MTPSKNNHTLRKVSAILYLTTLITTIIVLSTVSAIFPLSGQYASDIFPIVASTLATLFTLLMTLHSFLSPTHQTSTIHLSATLLSTASAVSMIAAAYLRRRSALLPCTAGDIGNNPYVSSCQLRQAVFWSAVVAAVAFVGDAVVAGSLYRVAKRERDAAYAGGNAVEIGDYAVEIGGGKDVEGEVEWSERVGQFDTRSAGNGKVGF